MIQGGKQCFVTSNGDHYAERAMFMVVEEPVIQLKCLRNNIQAVAIMATNAERV